MRISHGKDLLDFSITLSFDSAENAPSATHLSCALSLAPGQICAITGPSGVGKSSLLLALAGFREIESGDMSWQGASFLQTPIWERPLSFLLQSDNLFTHLSAYRNIALGALKSAKKHETEAKIDEITKNLGISDILNKPASQLSGGQQQRVGLARALLRQKPILLLDEPFSALDKGNREKALTLVKELTQAHQLATVIVTHDEDDIALLGASSLRLQR